MITANILPAIAKRHRRRYRVAVAANSAIRIGVLNPLGGHRLKSGFFVSAARQAFMGGPCGAAQAAPEPDPGTPTCTVPLTLIGVRACGV